MSEQAEAKNMSMSLTDQQLSQQIYRTKVMSTVLLHTITISKDRSADQKLNPHHNGS